MPSDPVRLLTRQRGIQLSPEAQQAKIEELGLRPAAPHAVPPVLGRHAALDFGDSFIYPGVSVGSVFLRDLWRTLLLVGTATVLMIVIGLYLGIRGGWKRDQPLDRASMGLSLAFYSMPDFWLGDDPADHLLNRARVVPVGWVRDARLRAHRVSHGSGTSRTICSCPC